MRVSPGDGIGREVHQVAGDGLCRAVVDRLEETQDLPQVVGGERDSLRRQEHLRLTTLVTHREGCGYNEVKARRLEPYAPQRARRRHGRDRYIRSERARRNGNDVRPYA